MLRAQDTVNRYTSQAQGDMGKAKALQAEATSLANQANAAPDKASASALSAGETGGQATQAGQPRWLTRPSTAF